MNGYFSISMFCFVFFICTFILSKEVSPDMHFKVNQQFLLESMSLTPTFTAPARLGPSTKSVQILPPDRFYIIFFTVS